MAGDSAPLRPLCSLSDCSWTGTAAAHLTRAGEADWVPLEEAVAWLMASMAAYAARQLESSRGGSVGPAGLALAVPAWFSARQVGSGAPWIRCYAWGRAVAGRLEF
jgi:hypothetical protein